MHDVAAHKPEFFSVTFGAGGSTRELTLETVLGLALAVLVADVVRRYDVDGVHIDDYFYPYPVTDAATKAEVAQETMVELRGLLNQAASHLETLRRAGAGSAA